MIFGGGTVRLFLITNEIKADFAICCAKALNRHWSQRNRRRYRLESFGSSSTKRPWCCNSDPMPTPGIPLTKPHGDENKQTQASVKNSRNDRHYCGYHCLPLQYLWTWTDLFILQYAVVLQNLDVEYLYEAPSPWSRPRLPWIPASQLCQNRSWKVDRDDNLLKPGSQHMGNISNSMTPTSTLSAIYNHTTVNIKWVDSEDSHCGQCRRGIVQRCQPYHCPSSFGNRHRKNQLRQSPVCPYQPSLPGPLLHRVQLSIVLKRMFSRYNVHTASGPQPDTTDPVIHIMPDGSSNRQDSVYPAPLPTFSKIP